MKKQGFTVIEMLIYLSLLTMFMVIVTSIFTSILDAQLQGEAISAVEGDSQYIYLRLAYDISRSTAIEVPANIGDTSSVLSLTINGVAVSYASSSGNLMRTTSGNSSSLNSYGSAITNMTFTKIGNANGKQSVKVHMTLRSLFQSLSGSQTRDLDTTFALR